jgi:hypothetical protein
MVTDNLRHYKRFIDGLVARLESVAARRIQQQWHYEIPSPEEQAKDRRTGNAPSPEMYQRFERYNQFDESLTKEQREMVAELLQGEKQAGMQEVLSYLTDNLCIVVVDGDALPFEPFDTPYHYDLDARIDGQPWPDEEGAS